MADADLSCVFLTDAAIDGLHPVDAEVADLPPAPQDKPIVILAVNKCDSDRSEA